MFSEPAAADKSRACELTEVRTLLVTAHSRPVSEYQHPDVDATPVDDQPIDIDDVEPASDNAFGDRDDARHDSIGHMGFLPTRTLFTSTGISVANLVPFVREVDLSGTCVGDAGINVLAKGSAGLHQSSSSSSIIRAQFVPFMGALTRSQPCRING